MASHDVLEISCALVSILIRASYRTGTAFDDLVEGQSSWDTG
jgi:hypothetical protein